MKPSKHASAFVNFIPEFGQCLADADGSEWPEDVRQDRLCGAISPKILEAIVGRTWPKSYDETVTLSRKITEDQYYLTQRNSGTAKSLIKSLIASTPKPEVDVIDWEPNAPTQGGGQQNGNLKGPGSPNDQLLIGKRARSVSREEIDRCKAEKVCWRCARRGCNSKGCPLAAPIRPRVKANNTNMERQTYDLAAVVDEAPDEEGRVEDMTKLEEE